ncbi:isoleucine--tRNA ligase [endosymbiont of Pachyrhynchus infernalis]|uniref:isoleucine--tRNA ligase n=1 Tax=endosymbiont of Pachyrhynchus infernalis TaxID=1971488 RepID=UPI000DC6D648|nr:isoleucine--tRNA ligase [endosymbiont of Pachyrhynchus infernalis]BBA84905.1 isoleucine--tRNA ligase [endosymbiont of Pachyrhynchus infernalis]
MNKNYKNTLNLPKTLFPMKGNLIKNEIKILYKWNKNNIYDLIQKSKLNKKIFLLHDGPPYANGNIHMGHALNKIIKDIIIKSKNLSGMNAPYIVGWDCHGLPIESKIENINNEKINKKEFRLKCRKYVIQQIDIQKSDFIRLGIFADWKNSYLTMNFKTISNIIKIFGKLVKLNYIKSGIKPIYWCINCKSVLSESEIIYKNITSKSLYIKFYIKNINYANKILNIDNYKVSLVIWTTTPWTLPDNEAISINPNIYYNLIEYNDEIIILSCNSLNNFIKENNIKNFINIKKILGKYILNFMCINPINNNTVPVIFDESINIEFGTGIVHIAPGHGQTDYEIGLKFNLNIKNSINKYGYYNDNTHKLLDKKFIFDSILDIINILKENNSLLFIKNYIHKYAFCYRHNYKIIFRVTNQWFIDLENNNLKNNIINEINKIRWIPKWGKNYIKEMIIKRKEWCISRQRNWGIPITLIINKYNNKLHPDIDIIIEKISNIIEKYGIQSWWDINLCELTENYKDYVKVYDVLDVWFDSGTTFFSVVKDIDKFKDKNYIDLCVEGIDQYRGWFMSSLLISIALNNKSSYKNILTHGFVIDKNKKKMSKSIGNIINPNELIKKFGSDIIRLWVSSSDYKKNISVSYEILDRVSDNYKKIRNTIRFLLSNLYDFDYNKDYINYENMVQIDLWILKKTYFLQKKIIYLYNSYNFCNVLDHIINFCSVDLSSNYLEIIKDRQYTLGKDSIPRRSCQTSIFYILESLVRWISPILSFTSEEIWEYIPGNRSKSIFTEEWFNKLKNINKYKILSNKIWNFIFNIKNEINKKIEIIKKHKVINSNLELHIYLYLDKYLFNEIKLLKNELHYIFITSKVTINKIENFPEKIKDFIHIGNNKIFLDKINGIKCNRCWHLCEVNNKINYKKEDYICNRCFNNMNNINEIRKFV